MLRATFPLPVFLQSHSLWDVVGAKDVVDRLDYRLRRERNAEVQGLRDSDKRYCGRGDLDRYVVLAIPGERDDAD